MQNTLMCGAAREKITPPPEWIPYLRGLMNAELGGVVDDLYVRAAVLRSGENALLLVSFDADKAPCPEECLRLAEEASGIPQDNILLTAIHTHSAPVTGARPYEGPNALARKPAKVQEITIQYEQFMKERMLAAVSEAMRRMEPAVMGYGVGESYVNVSRIAFYETEDEKGGPRTVLGTGTNFGQEVDHTLFVMRLTSIDGKPLFYLLNYPVHNTVMILNACGANGTVGISADLAGNVTRQMEESFDGSVCIWTSGAAGDVNPIMSNQVYREDPQTGLPTEVYEKDGAIALSMLRTLTAHHFADVRKAERRIRTCTDAMQLSAAAAWAEVDGQDEEGNPVPYRVRVHRMSIGPVRLYSFSGEVYSGLGKRLKENLLSWLGEPAPEVLLVNHDASLLYNAGYIYGDEIFALNEQYEGEIVGMNHTWLKPGQIEEALLACMKALTPRQGREITGSRKEGEADA